MKNHELIAHLQTLPLDAEVIYSECSDWSEMDESQVEYQLIFKRNGHYVRVTREQYPPDEVPIQVGCITFPGN